MSEQTSEQTKVERYKVLINEAKELYASMTDEEVKQAEDWLDEEFRKESEPQREDAITNVVATH